jgi:hypothetical protein
MSEKVTQNKKIGLSKNFGYGVTVSARETGMLGVDLCPSL